jgi:hypothetical protein
MRRLERDGMLLESARGPLPNVAELVAGEPIRGSWWAHHDSHAIFAVINEVADSPDVVRIRLVEGKITLVHRRLWPALVRLAEHYPYERLAAVREEHTETGAHRKVVENFPDWVPAAEVAVGAALEEADALAILPPAVRPKVASG